MDNTKILDITNDVKWIGILDEDIVTFDIVMETQYGTTYNSYFINAGKKAIIDTAKETFWDAYINKLKKCVTPGEIEYIIVSHTEPDHSGNIEHLLKLAPDAKIVGSRQAINFLNEMISRSFQSVIVKNNNTLLPVYKLFAIINPVRDKGKKAAAFGSFGWSGEAVKIIKSQLRLLKLNVVCDSYTAKFSPNKDKPKQLTEFGRRFANHLSED